MEGIKLTNFTKSKEIYDFLERQFTNEFRVLKIPKNSSKLIDFIISVFKDYPSFRMYFTGYTNDEKEAITYLMSTLDLTKPNQIKTKIASSLSTEEIKDFILCIFEEDEIDYESNSSENENFYCETKDGDVVTGEVYDRDLDDNYICVQIESDELFPNKKN